MATPDEHRQQAEHNREFLKTIDKSLFPDWAATVIFYIALHEVQMMLQSKGYDLQNHRDRNRRLRESFRDVWRQYSRLYNFSRLSRYRCMDTKAHQIPPLEERLVKLEAEVRNAMT